MDFIYFQKNYLGCLIVHYICWKLDGGGTIGLWASLENIEITRITCRKTSKIWISIGMGSGLNMVRIKNKSFSLACNGM